MQWLWTWGGKSFGYRDGDNLWTQDGRHVGRFRGDEVYGTNGRYLNEIRSENRLIMNLSKKSKAGPGFTPYASQVGSAPYVDYVGNVMYAGFEDFPGHDEL